MTTLNDCINFNSNAVALLRAGKKEEAADTVRQSLRRLESLLFDSKSALPADPASKMQSQRHVPIHSVPVENTSDNSPNNLFSFYPKMINIADDSDDSMRVSNVFVVLLYNFTVLNHIKIMSEDCPAPSKLMKCLELYESAMNVVQNSWSASDADAMLLVILAVSNNMGHINSHLLNFQQTRESIALQMHLLGKCSEKNAVPLEDYGIFFEGICVFLDGHDLNLAPAA